MTLAITGANGQLGRLVLQALTDAPEVLALVRDPAKGADLGRETRAFDYDRPETLAPALAGVSTLLLISGSEVGRRGPQHRAVIEAAKDAGVERLVYTSLLKADVSPLSLAPEHRETEAMLAESGLATTILRNGWYMENQTAGVPAALAHGALAGAAGEGRFAAAARADYAAAAATVLTGEDHAGKVYELAGAPAYTLADLAAEISRQAGREIPYADLGEAGYAEALKGAGLPAGLAEAIASWDAAAPSGCFDHDAGDLKALVGRPLIPLAEAVAAAMPKTAA